MALYVIDAIRFGPDGEPSACRWFRADGARNKIVGDPEIVETDRVVEAFDRGDIVEMRFAVHGSHASGGAVVRKVLADGRESFREEHAGEGRMLVDLPRC